MNSDLLDIFLRLAAATAVGMILGLNRDLHGKPTGMRTLGLVSLGVAVATVAVLKTGQAVQSIDAYSRLLQGIVQGVLTGIGFLGGGVILRSPATKSVLNLTTAATVWVTAALGIACAVASWWVIAMGTALAIVLLAVSDHIDKFIMKTYGDEPARDKETDRPPR